MRWLKLAWTLDTGYKTSGEAIVSETESSPGPIQICCGIAASQHSARAPLEAFENRPGPATATSRCYGTTCWHERCEDREGRRALSLL